MIQSKNSTDGFQGIIIGDKMFGENQGARDTSQCCDESSIRESATRNEVIPLKSALGREALKHSVNRVQEDKNNESLTLKNGHAASSTQIAKLVVLLSDPKESFSKDVEDFFDSSVEIADPFSTELFDSHDVLRDVSVEVVDEISPTEDHEFTIITARNITDGSPTDFQRTLMRKLPPERGSLGFVSERKNGDFSATSHIETQVHLQPTASSSMGIFRAGTENNNFGATSASQDRNNLEDPVEIGLTSASVELSSRAPRKPDRVRVSRRKLESGHGNVNASSSIHYNNSTNADHLSSQNPSQFKHFELDGMPQPGSQAANEIQFSKISSNSFESQRQDEFSASESHLKLQKEMSPTSGSERTPFNLNNSEVFVSQYLQPPLSDLSTSEIRPPTDSTPLPQQSSPILLVGEDFDDEFPYRNDLEFRGENGTPQKIGSLHPTNDAIGTKKCGTHESAALEITHQHQGSLGGAKSFVFGSPVWDACRENHGEHTSVDANKVETHTKELKTSSYVVPPTKPKVDAHTTELQTSSYVVPPSKPKVDTHTNELQTSSYVVPPTQPKVSAFIADMNNGMYYSLTALVPKEHLKIGLIDQHKGYETYKPIDLIPSRDGPQQRRHKGLASLSSLPSSFQKSTQAITRHQAKLKPPMSFLDHASWKSRDDGKLNNVYVHPTFLPKVTTRGLDYRTKGGTSWPRKNSMLYQPIKSSFSSTENLRVDRPESRFIFAWHPAPEPKFSHSNIRERVDDFLPLASMHEFLRNDDVSRSFKVINKTENFQEFNMQNILVPPTGRQLMSSQHSDEIKNNSFPDSSIHDREKLKHANPLGHEKNMDHHKNSSNVLLLPRNTLTSEFADSYRKFENRSGTTYDFSFHFHRDLAKKSEFRRRHSSAD
ncbi:uncharacterized protein LOC125178963 [Hyalella azteca]|uniref:Uncharacterized protein LOC125178963 n=1 Tax=Hyalella azteca TaxID=294128 RepID=A0A979FRV9_HYAAZ|nr:uncharacterized protein LOC125178963 [Hyalella azteca]